MMLKYLGLVDDVSTFIEDGIDRVSQPGSTGNVWLSVVQLMIIRRNLHIGVIGVLRSY